MVTIPSESKPVTGIIYKATCLVDGKCYVGMTTKGLEHRKKAHLLKAARKDGEYFHLALNAHGPENFTWEVIEQHPTVKATQIAEIEAIKKFKSFHLDGGYNLTRGGEGSFGWIPSEEFRRKAGERQKGTVRSEEYKIKMRAATKGIVHSLEHNQKVSLAMRGKPKSEEQKRKQSIAMTGRIASPETRKKLSIVHSGRIHSLESKLKIGAGNKGKIRSLEARKKVSDGLKKFFASKT